MLKTILLGRAMTQKLKTLCAYGIYTCIPRRACDANMQSTSVVAAAAVIFSHGTIVAKVLA